MGSLNLQNLQLLAGFSLREPSGEMTVGRGQPWLLCCQVIADGPNLSTRGHSSCQVTILIGLSLEVLLMALTPCLEMVKGLSSYSLYLNSPHITQFEYIFYS